MNRNEYLQDADVREFTKWATKLVTGKWGQHLFEGIRGAQYTKHADSNLKAAWLLGALAKVDGSEFDSVPSERRVLALQSALFMLGYRTLNDDAVVKRK